MATLREGNKPVLLVVDVQVGVMNESWMPFGSSRTWRALSSELAPRVCP